MSQVQNHTKSQGSAYNTIVMRSINSHLALTSSSISWFGLRSITSIVAEKEEKSR